MARRTKQKSIIDRRKRGSNLKRMGVTLCVVTSAVLLYFALVFCINHAANDNENKPISPTPDEVKTTGTVILLTTPTPQLTEEAQNTFEPTQTSQPTAE